MIDEDLDGWNVNQQSILVIYRRLGRVGCLHIPNYTFVPGTVFTPLHC